MRRNQDNRSSDLCAQWKAADSAFAAAWWAKWQTLLSLVGVIGLLYNLYLTRTATNIALAATKDADKALEIAARNADTAAEHVAHAKDAAQRQLRAYLFVDNVLLTDHGIKSSSDVLLKLKNTGGTPAYKVRSAVQIEFHPDRRASFVLPDLKKNDSKIIIMDVGGGGLRGRKYTRKARDFADGKAIRATDCHAHVFGRISYIDCFGIKRNGSFHFVGRADPRSSGSIDMDYADKGNEYD